MFHMSSHVWRLLLRVTLYKQNLSVWKKARHKLICVPWSMSAVLNVSLCLINGPKWSRLINRSGYDRINLPAWLMVRSLELRSKALCLVILRYMLINIRARLCYATSRNSLLSFLYLKLLIMIRLMNTATHYYPWAAKCPLRCRFLFQGRSCH